MVIFFSNYLFNTGQTKSGNGTPLNTPWGCYCSTSAPPWWSVDLQQASLVFSLFQAIEPLGFSALSLSVNHFVLVVNSGIQSVGSDHIQIWAKVTQSVTQVRSEHLRLKMYEFLIAAHALSNQSSLMSSEKQLKKKKNTVTLM